MASVSRIRCGVSFSKAAFLLPCLIGLLLVVFNVDLLSAIEWQDDAFDQLVLPSSQKALIKGLVESHRGPNEEDEFDDFIMGKGRGLIINLFGPPGVGKTLSAEATSECKSLLHSLDRYS